MAGLIDGRIGVLMGGPSSERDISLKSGRAVYESLKRLLPDVVAIDITTDNAQEARSQIESRSIKCAFLALHGRFGEDGQVQKILEDLNIPYTGSGVFASRLAMDKAASRRIFADNGLIAPRSRELLKGLWQNGAEKCSDCGFGFPLVVKPATGGSSIGLSIVDKSEDLESAVRLAFGLDERILIEEYIDGREVTVGIVDEEPLDVIEIMPKKRFFDYEAKYKVGMTEYDVPAKLDAPTASRLKEAALSAHKLIGCSGCSRVDMILRAGKEPFILEINTIPGFTETSLLPKAARLSGMDFFKLCLKLIELAYEKDKV